MPRGIYIRTKEHNKNNSKAKKGKHSSPITEIKIGEHLSLNTEIEKGKHFSPNTEFKVGQIPWNKGKINIFLGENNPFYGKHHSEETKRKISETHRGREMSSLEGWYIV